MRWEAEWNEASEVKDKNYIRRMLRQMRSILLTECSLFLSQSFLYYYQIVVNIMDSNEKERVKHGRGTYF